MTGFYPTNQITLYLLRLFYSDNEIITVHGRPAICTLICWIETSRLCLSFIKVSWSQVSFSILSSGKMMCYLLPMLQDLPSHVIMLSLVSISIERWRTIIYTGSGTFKINMKFVLPIIWIISSLLVLPYAKFISHFYLDVSYFIRQLCDSLLLDFNIFVCLCVFTVVASLWHFQLKVVPI